MKKVPKAAKPELESHIKTRVGGYNLFDRIFLWLSGVDLYILSFGKQEKTKFVTVGGTVLAVGLLAFMTMYFAVTSLLGFSGVAAFIPSSLWAFIIISLDRFILAATTYTENLFDRLVINLPRILLALLIALVISEPIILRIFSNEVEQGLVSIRNARIEELTEEYKTDAEKNYKSDSTVLTKNIKSISVDIKSVDFSLQDKTMLLEEEYNGKRGNGIKGKGPRYDEIKADIMVILNRKSKLETDLDRNKTELEGAYTRLSYARENAKSLAQSNAAKINGLLYRIEALSAVSDKRPLLWISIWLVRLLLIMLEITPVMFKIFTKKSAYDTTKEQIDQLSKETVETFKENESSNFKEQLDALAEMKMEASIEIEAENVQTHKAVLTAEKEVISAALAEWKSDQITNMKERYKDYFMQNIQAIKPPMGPSIGPLSSTSNIPNKPDDTQAVSNAVISPSSGTQPYQQQDLKAADGQSDKQSRPDPHGDKRVDMKIGDRKKNRRGKHRH